MSDSPRPRSPAEMLPRVALQLVIVLGALGVLLFGAAGRLDWAAAWWFIGSYGVFLTLYAVWGLFRDPEQFAERMSVRRAPDAKGWDRVIIRLYTALLVVLLIVIGLDAGRLRWSAVPTVVRAVAWLGLAASAAWAYWVVRANTFLSGLVRIQSDRGHRPVTTGPYRYVRHPMYAGLLVTFVCVPLALGSWWGLAPGALTGALFVLRTAMEDRTLQHELEGYDEYARQVRYRLVPGVW